MCKLFKAFNIEELSNVDQQSETNVSTPLLDILYMLLDMFTHFLDQVAFTGYSVHCHDDIFLPIVVSCTHFINLDHLRCCFIAKNKMLWKYSKEL